MEPVQLVQRKINQSNTCRNDLSRLHLNNEPIFQETASEGKHSDIPVSVAYPIYPSGNWQHQLKLDNSIPCRAILDL